MTRRFGYLMAGLIWLVLMCLPLVAVVVAIQGELKIGDMERSHVRIFMVRSDESTGVGAEWSRGDVDERKCFDTSVRYLLWEGDSTGVNVDYCDCQLKSGALNHFNGSCDDFTRPDE